MSFNGPFLIFFRVRIFLIIGIHIIIFRRKLIEETQDLGKVSFYDPIIIPHEPSKIKSEQQALDILRLTVILPRQ